MCSVCDCKVEVSYKYLVISNFWSEHQLWKEAVEEWIASNKYVLLVCIQENREHFDGINWKFGKISINICVSILRNLIIYDKIAFGSFNLKE